MVWCSQCLRHAWEGWAVSTGLPESIAMVLPSAVQVEVSGHEFRGKCTALQAHAC